MKKPVIASVQGHCLGGGCELAMVCDLTIAADDALFGEPEIRFSNVGPVMVMPWIIGLKRARELLYLGDPIDARTALAYGMVNRVVARAELMTATLRVARRMALMSPEALAATKLAVNRGAECAGFLNAMHAGVDVLAALYAARTEVARSSTRSVRRKGSAPPCAGAPPSSPSSDVVSGGADPLGARGLRQARAPRGRRPADRRRRPVQRRLQRAGAGVRVLRPLAARPRAHRPHRRRRRAQDAGRARRAHRGRRGGRRAQADSAPPRSGQPYEPQLGTATARSTSSPRTRRCPPTACGSWARRWPWSSPRRRRRPATAPRRWAWSTSRCRS